MELPGWIFNYYMWIKIAGIILLAWLAFRLKKTFHKTLIKHRDHGDFDLNPLSLDFFEKGISVLIFFVSFLWMLQVIGIDIVPLLTLSGIGAGAIALASKDVIANLFGGLMIYMSRSFSLCDYIELPQKKIAGSVEEIGWYFTTLRDSQKRPIYLPNSIFSTELILNHSRISYRLIEEKIRIRKAAGERTEQIVGEIRELLMRHSEIDQKGPIDVYLLSISPWGLEIGIKATTVAVQYQEFMEIKQKILLEIYQIAVRHESL